MKKNVLTIVLLFAVVFGGCYMYADNHMSEDEINNVMRYIPFKEKPSIKRDSSKKHNIKKKEAERSDADNKNIPESVKKKSHAKETITVESYKCQYCGDTIYYIIEDKEYGINGDICWACYWNKIMDIIYEQTEEDVEEEESIGECCWCGRDISPYENYNYTEDNQLICSNCYPNYCEWLDSYEEQEDTNNEDYDDNNDDEYIEEDICYYCSDCGSKAYYDDDCYPYCWDCYCKHQEEDYNVDKYEEDNYYDNTEEEPEEYDTEEYNEEDIDTTDDGEDMFG